MSRQYAWEAAQIRCPFYLASTGQKGLLCEGHGEGMKTETRFKTGSQKEFYLACYCSSNFEDCPVYQNAMAKYNT